MLLLGPLATAPLVQAQGGDACTCQELRKWLDEAKRFRDAYASLVQDGAPMHSQQDLDEDACIRAGFKNCISLGKPGEADQPPPPDPADPTKKPKSPRQEALDRCRAERCDWYCEVAIDTVHEGYHDWYQALLRPYYSTRMAISLLGWGEYFWTEEARQEAGAWQATIEFLEDKIEESVNSGNCDDVRGSPKRAEQQIRWETARKTVDDYIQAHPETVSEP